MHPDALASLKARAKRSYWACALWTPGEPPPELFGGQSFGPASWLGELYAAQPWPFEVRGALPESMRFRRLTRRQAREVVDQPEVWGPSPERSYIRKQLVGAGRLALELQGMSHARRGTFAAYFPEFYREGHGWRAWWPPLCCCGNPIVIVSPAGVLTWFTGDDD